MGLTKDGLTYCEKLLVEEQCLSLKNNRERIEFILKNMKPLTEFRDQVFKRVHKYCKKHEKSLKRSQKYRIEAKKYFDHKEYYSAINSFTKAILNAPFPSETNHCNELYLAYESRAVAFFKIKIFTNALFDTNRAIELIPTLELFLQKFYCLRALKRYEEGIRVMNQLIEMVNRGQIDLKEHKIDELIELRKMNVNDVNRYEYDMETESFKTELEPTHNFFIHSNCQIRSTPSKGRHYIARQNIAKDTIIAIEKPYSLLMNPDYVFKYCNNCYNKLEYEIWPCFRCNEVVFCDKKCSQEADQFHRYECGFAGILTQWFARHVFKIFTKIESINASNLEQFFESNFDFNNEYLNSERQRTVPQKDKTLSEKWTELKAMSTLEHNSDKHEKCWDVNNSFTAIHLAILMNYRKIIDFDITTNFDSFVKIAECLIVYMRRICINAFSWAEYRKEDIIQIGSFVSIVSSLVNHNCDPNTEWKFIDRKLVITSVRDISADEEVNITYIGAYKGGSDFYVRQSKLKNNYYFSCNCNLCLEDAKNVSALQCRDCDGPVISDIRFCKTSNGMCLKCGNNYKSFKKVTKKVESNTNLLKGMIKNIKNELSTEFSLLMAEKALEALIEVVYHKSNHLLAKIRQLIGIFEKLGKYSNALKFYKHFMPSIEAMKSEETFSQVSKDLVLWTDIFYMYLKDGKVDDKDVLNTCLSLYSKLIGFLETVTKDEKIQSKKRFTKMLKTKREEFDCLEKVFISSQIRNVC